MASYGRKKATWSAITDVVRKRTEGAKASFIQRRYEALMEDGEDAMERDMTSSQKEAIKELIESIKVCTCLVTTKWSCE